MKHLLLAIFILLAAAPSRAGAASTPTPLTPDCRYLFIVDTSLSMARLQDQTSAALQRMITSGLDGQMSPGEVFTIWTFNEAVYQRDYPLNSWRPELNQTMGNRVGQYLQSQRYRRDPNMRALLNALNQARQICPRIAIFLISNGREVLVGTPFDRNINVNYGRRFAELQAARVPFLTTLVCQDGRFVAYAVNAANEPINIPPGPDGNLVVGRPKQVTPIGPTPVMTTNRPTPIAPLVQATNRPANAAAPVTPVPTNQAIAKPVNNRPGVITLPGPPPTARKVVELTPKPRDPDEPRVVKPTDIAPSRKPARPVFRKTNRVEQAGATVKPATNAPPATASTNTAPATNTPTMQVAKVAAPRPRSSATMTVKSANRPAPQTTNTVTAPPAPKPPAPAAAALSQPEPEVVIQVVTQIVMVPLPAITPETPAPQPQPTPEPKPQPKVEPKPVAVTNAPPAPPAASAVVATPEPATNAAPRVATPPAVTNVAAAAPAPTAPAPEPQSVATLFGPNAQNKNAWLFLAGGILALLIVIAAVRRLMATRPGESSMISQSMEHRDNG